MPLPNRGGSIATITGEYLNADDYLMQRDILDAVANTYSDQSFLSFLELTNRATVSANSQFNHFESGSVFRKAIVSAAAPTGTAAQAVIVLAAAAHSTVGGVNRSFPKVGDMVYNPITNIHGRVIAKNTATPDAHTITVARRTGTADSMITGFPANAQFATYTSAYADGTGMPAEGTDNPLTRFFAQMQIIKTKKSINGSADANKLTVKLSGKEYYAFKLEAEALIEHRLKVAYAGLLGAGGSTVDENGAVVPLMTGMDTFVRTLGNVQPLTTANTWAFADIEAMIATIETEAGGSEYIGLQGYKDKLAWDRFWITQMSGGAISYNTFGSGDGKQNAIDLGFHSVEHGGITFHSAKYSPFNHKEITGLTGSPYLNVGLWIPAESQTISENGKISSVPSTQVRYKLQSDGTSRRMKSYKQGQEITTIDKLDWYMQSEEGIQMAMLNKFIRTANP